jgi:hypothetical protein
MVGGHFDVDSTTSIGGKGTHEHEYDTKFDTVCVDLFNPQGKTEGFTDNVANGQPFRLQALNANLNAGARLAINSVYQQATGSGAFDTATCQHTSGSTWVYSTEFDDAASPVFSIGGLTAGADCELTSLSVCFHPTEPFTCAGIMPTETSCVKSNTPGANGEWRNGAFALQAVPVTAAGALLPGCSLDASVSSGDHGAVSAGASECLLQEWAIFWHWKFEQLEGSTCPVPDAACSKSCYGEPGWASCMDAVFGPTDPASAGGGCLTGHSPVLSCE